MFIKNFLKKSKVNSNSTSFEDLKAAAEDYSKRVEMAVKPMDDYTNELLNKMMAR